MTTDPADHPAPGDAAPALRVLAAPPFATIQDLGRPGWRHLGIPAGGAMDRWALQAANVLAGNAAGAAALEWSVGGGLVRFERDLTIALAGADCLATLDGRPVAAWMPLRVRAGDRLALGAPRRGRFLYLAVAGGLAVPPVLGSAATYLPAAFGGVAGRRLRDGDLLAAGPSPDGEAGGACPPELRVAIAGWHDGRPHDEPVRVVAGPQAALLDDAGWARLLGPGLAVSMTSDRSGYRLRGVAVPPSADAAERPSEPGCPGALQLPPDGEPIVLMADAPTVGGYPKPAVVCAADLGRLAQHAPGDPVRLALVSLDEAQRLYRRRSVAVWTLSELRRRRIDGVGRGT